MTQNTSEKVLSAPMVPADNDAHAKSVRDYLLALVEAVWTQQEGFSGKRPFGASGWSWDLIEPLAEAGLIEATIDENGYVEAVDDERAYERLILDAIRHMRAAA